MINPQVTNYGNLEITVENMTKEQLESLMDFVVEKVDSMHLVMVARAYMTSENDDDGNSEEETKPAKEAKESAS